MRHVIAYNLEYLPAANLDVLEAEVYLYERSLSAASKFVEAIRKQDSLIIDNPFRYKVYDGKPYFRYALLPYRYLYFYHVSEETKTVTVHRVLRGMRNIPNIL